MSVFPLPILLAILKCCAIFRAVRNSILGGPALLFIFCRWLEVLEFNRQSERFKPTSSTFELQPTAAVSTTRSRSPWFIVSAASVLNSQLDEPEVDKEKKKQQHTFTNNTLMNKLPALINGSAAAGARLPNGWSASVTQTPTSQATIGELQEVLIPLLINKGAHTQTHTRKPCCSPSAGGKVQL